MRENRPSPHLPSVDPGQIWGLFRSGEATHFCGAPTVLTMLVNDPAAARLERPVRLLTAAAPPSPTVIGQMAELNFHLEHVYGLTETYGPITMCPEQEGARELPVEQRARNLARQGQAYIAAADDGDL